MAALREVLPPSSVDDVLDRPARDGELTGQFPLARATCRIPSTDFNYIFVRQASGVVGLPWLPQISSAALRDLVPGVIQMGAQEKVPGVSAGRVVTTVQYEQAVWDGAVHERPCDSMSAFQPPTDLERAVPAASVRGQPRPAIHGPPGGDLAPKTLSCNGGCVHVAALIVTGEVLSSQR